MSVSASYMPPTYLSVGDACTPAQISLVEESLASVRKMHADCRNGNGTRTPAQDEKSALSRKPMLPDEQYVLDLAFNEKVDLVYRLKEGICELSAYDKAARRTKIFRVREEFLKANTEAMPEAVKQFEAKEVDEFDDELKEEDKSMREEMLAAWNNPQEDPDDDSAKSGAAAAAEKKQDAIKTKKAPVDLLAGISSTEMEVVHKSFQALMRTQRKAKVLLTRIVEDQRRLNPNGAPRRTLESTRELRYAVEKGNQETTALCRAIVNGKEVINGKVKEDQPKKAPARKRRPNAS